MARTAKSLTALDLKRLKQGTIAVGGVSGLYFRKTKFQALFILRFTDESGRHDVSLGNYPDMNLAKARAEAFACVTGSLKAMTFLLNAKDRGKRKKI